MYNLSKNFANIPRATLTESDNRLSFCHVKFVRRSGRDPLATVGTKTSVCHMTKITTPKTQKVGRVA